jgi:hypothetical protein
MKDLEANGILVKDDRADHAPATIVYLDCLRHGNTLLNFGLWISFGLPSATKVVTSEAVSWWLRLNLGVMLVPFYPG